MIESYESEKLNKLINNKKNYFETLNSKTTHAQILQDEILFLQNTILPVVLNETTILYNEAQKYVSSKITQATNNGCDAVLFLIPLADYLRKNNVLIGIANPKEQTTNYDMENIDIDITISSVGEYRSKIKTLTLPLWEEK